LFLESRRKSVKRRLWLGLAVAEIASMAAASAQTADELIAKNIEARGGLEKIQAIQSMRLTGTLSVGDAAMPSLLEVKRPNKTRWEFTVNGQTAVQAYDGTTAWAAVPFAGRAEPERMSAEDSKDMELQADMDGPLVNYRAKGHRVELMGLEKIADHDAWRLKVTLRNGDVRDVFLDLKTHLQIVTVAHRIVQGKPAEIESKVGDYREVGDILLPYSFETTARGIPQKQSVRFDKIELNVPIEDSRFRMPAAKKPAEAPQPTPTPATTPASGLTPAETRSSR
jgi:outer membrane lipoprotein-sorting protein